MNIEKFMGTLERFAGHLRNEGEIKAAEAIEAVLKAAGSGVLNSN